ncbi:hypothetical protein SELSPUOL_01773 [Selenomonas sputigena ATCC 35185]|uniref:Uncharacterized protein n=1 Tax=Selenomonas sputigena (strain ATCC 35185 / DSM 20758 / CCUG 44933 / VPI D19B-28) TaxID=546271 RepID=C9LWB9_SELS3|nr:hypothetical protein SELSPUOL_01773 [Selenomonas sputigena ATCC 35185]
MFRLFAARSSQATRLSYFIREGLSSTFLNFFELLAVVLCDNECYITRTR